MNAALLCPGPSLARLAMLPPCDCVLAVNRAALRWACDVWCALDHWSEKPGCTPGGVRNWAKDVIGSPLLLTCRGSADAVAKRQPWRGAVEAIESFRDACPVKGWTLYSATAALVYAAQSHQRITVYGADMAGTLDFDNAAAGVKRDEARWQSERYIWGEVVAALKQRGVEVNRVCL
jgi:hypothetical protein